jgi:hypothetical protein
MKEVPLYEKWANGWQAQVCPLCGSKQATAHAYIFAEAAPPSPEPDNRKPIGEAFLHADKTECRSESLRSIG